MRRLFWMVLFCAAAAPLQAQLVWVPAATGHGGHHGPQTLQLQDGEGSRVEYWLPTLAHRPLPLKAGRVTARPTGIDNYHALVAQREAGSRHESAVRYLFAFGKPSGRSPSELTAAIKAPLELVPAPLPREHWRYLSGEAVHFVLRYKGVPRAGIKVQLRSANGSRFEQLTDSRGRVTFRLPDDFASVTPGRRHNPPAQMVVAAAYRDRGQHYLTTLSAPYYVNPRHWQSSAAAVGMLAIGFAVGLGVIVVAGRRREGGAV